MSDALTELPYKMRDDTVTALMAGDIETARRHLSECPVFQEDVFNYMVTSNDIQGLCNYAYELSSYTTLSNDVIEPVFVALNGAIKDGCTTFCSSVRPNDKITITAEMYDTLRYTLAYNRGYDMDAEGGVQ